MRKLITIILAVVLLVTLINFNNKINESEQTLTKVTQDNKELDKAVKTLESKKESLTKQVNELRVDNVTLKSEVSKLDAANKELNRANKDVEEAYQNEYPDISVTLKDFVQNFEYVVSNVDNFKEKELKLPNEGEVLMGDKNFNTRYHIDAGELNYTFNIGSRLNKNNLLKIRINYNNLTKDEEKAIKINDYTAAILSAYFMALDSPMEYTDAVAESVRSLMETGNYARGDIVMKCSLDPASGYMYIKNRHGLLSIFD